MFLLCPSVSRTRVRVMCMKTNPEGNNAFKALSQYLLSYQTHTETWNKNWFLISSFFPSVHIQKPESCTFLHWWHPGWSSSPLFIQECLLIFLWCLMPSEWAPKPENTHTCTQKNASLNWHFKQSFCLLPDSYSSLLPPLLLFLLLSLSPSLLPVIPKHSFYPLIPSLSPTHTPQMHWRVYS